MFDPSLWWLFPLSLCVATIAMMSGIGGAIMFTPILILVLGMDPLHAVATGLAIEIFGFSSGLFGYIRAKSISYPEFWRLVRFSFPATILGVLLSHFFPSDFLQLVIIFLLVILSISFLCIVHGPLARLFSRISSRAFVALGGLLMGLTSTGLGELDDYVLLRRLKLTPPLVAGTSVFLVAVSALIGVLGHMVLLITSGTNIFEEILPVLFFAVPGVVFGAQLGVRLVRYVSARLMTRLLAFIFLALALLLVLTF